MITSVRYEKDADPAFQVQAAGIGGQLVLLALLWASVGLEPVGRLAGISCAVFTCAILTRALRRTPGRRPGPADHVTLARAVLTGGVTALVADRLMTGGDGASGPLVAVVVLASVALFLDAVDGQVARRTGTVSPMGARFDMEVDAFLVLVLSVYVSTHLGAWVLVIGTMRYVFVAASWAMPWLSGALPHSIARKAVAALQGIVLVVATAGVLPMAVAVSVVGLSLAVLVWSFGRDVGWLWRSRNAPA